MFHEALMSSCMRPRSWSSSPTRSARWRSLTPCTESPCATESRRWCPSAWWT